MTKGRLEAFSDGVVAIIITIMVIELKPPADSSAHALHDSAMELLIYLLSFVFVAIYWNNHHHMLHACRRVTGAVLWANTHLLFWLSLVPYSTKWLHLEGVTVRPTVAYGVLLFLSAVAFTILKITLIRADGADSKLLQATGSDFKGKISIVLYGIGIVVSFVQPVVAIVIYAVVALIWLVPDRRVERALLD